MIYDRSKAEICHTVTLTAQYALDPHSILKQLIIFYFVCLQWLPHGPEEEVPVLQIEIQGLREGKQSKLKIPSLFTSWLKK